MNTKPPVTCYLLWFAILAAVCLLLSACAGTTVYRGGQKILFTQANAKSLEFRQGDTFLRIDGLNHSTPTRAGGSVAGTIGSSVVAGAALFAKPL